MKTMQMYNISLTVYHERNIKGRWKVRRSLKLNVITFVHSLNKLVTFKIAKLTFYFFSQGTQWF